jgi:hypothetical protein
VLDTALPAEVENRLLRRGSRTGGCPRRRGPRGGWIATHGFLSSSPSAALQLLRRTRTASSAAMVGGGVVADSSSIQESGREAGGQSVSSACGLGRLSSGGERAGRETDAGAKRRGRI